MAFVRMNDCDGNPVIFNTRYIIDVTKNDFGKANVNQVGDDFVALKCTVGAAETAIRKALAEEKK